MISDVLGMLFGRSTNMLDRWWVEGSTSAVETTLVSTAMLGLGMFWWTDISWNSLRGLRLV